MKDKEQEERKIIVKATPEMANWMHPQTEERKELIERRKHVCNQRTKRYLSKAISRSFFMLARNLYLIHPFEIKN